MTDDPERAALAHLAGNGWRMLPQCRTADEAVALHLARWWPGRVVDAVYVQLPHSGCDTAQAFAVRVNALGDCVWRCCGSLVEVCDKLRALPDPTDPKAPRLVLPGIPEFTLTAGFPQL